MKGSPNSYKKNKARGQWVHKTDKRAVFLSAAAKGVSGEAWAPPSKQDPWVPLEPKWKQHEYVHKCCCFSFGPQILRETSFF